MKIRRVLTIGSLWVAIAWAYGPLWRAAASAVMTYDVDDWFFLPRKPAYAPALAVAGWLLWRRIGSIRSAPPSQSPLAAGFCAFAGVLCFGAAYLHSAPHLLLLALAFHAQGVGASIRGYDGMRRLLAPSLVLLLGVPLPAPLENEALWHLQQWTARDVAWLVGVFGQHVSASGTLLWDERVTFQVIEGCTSYQSTLTLAFVAVAVAELRCCSGARTMLLLAATPVLAYLLNLARVAVLVSREYADASDVARGHLLPGVAILLAGATILYFAGGTRTATVAGSDDRGAAESAAWRRRDVRALGISVAIVAILAAGLSIHGGFASDPMSPIAFPEERRAWVGTARLPTGPDQFFYGPLPWEEVVSRRYERAGVAAHAVDLLVVPDLPGEPSTGVWLGSKAPLPGPDWEIRSLQPARIWALGLDADRAVVSDGRRHDPDQLVLCWRLRSGGVWFESLRAFIGLDSSSARGARPRTLVRLSTAIRNDDPIAIDAAKKTLDRFIADFRGDLDSL